MKLLADDAERNNIMQIMKMHNFVHTKHHLPLPMFP